MLSRNFLQSYTVNPSTRYRNIPRRIEHERILALYDTDAAEELEFLKEKFVGKQASGLTTHVGRLAIQI